MLVYQRVVRDLLGGTNSHIWIHLVDHSWLTAEVTVESGHGCHEKPWMHGFVGWRSIQSWRNHSCSTIIYPLVNVYITMENHHF